MCGCCRAQLQPVMETRKVQDVKVFVFYVYNRFLEGLLFQYKEGRDRALAHVFFDEIRTYIERTYRRHTLILMPSSMEKTRERGFYPMAEMLEGIRMNKLCPFLKTDNIKQSAQRFVQRTRIQEHIVLNPHVILPEGPLLLIDDVMTSGSTMRTAYQLLCAHHDSIQCCVLSMHELLLESSEKI